MRKLLATIAAIATIAVGGAAAPAAAAPATVKAAAAPDSNEWISKTNDRVRKSAPPVDPGARRGEMRAAAAPPDGSAVYWYSGGYQNVTNEGANAGLRNFTAGPYKHGYDLHTHVEIATIDTNGGAGRNIVEIGWGNSYCAGTPPCLWGFHWVNGVPAPGGYNSAFTDWSSSLNLGDSLAGTTESAGCTSSATQRNQRFGTRWNTGATPGWMLWADLCYGDATPGEWLGQFNHTLWTSQGETFTQSDQTQIFEEVTSWYEPSVNVAWDGIPCSDAGPGGLANSGSTYPGSGQRVGDIVLATVANSSVNFTTFTTVGGNYFDPSGMYNAVALATEPAGNVRYYNAGGPGSAGTTPGVKVTPGVAGGC